MQNLFLILSKIKKSRPPCSVDLVKKISLIDWNLITDEEIGTSIEIVLLISATVIVCTFDICGDEREEYRKYFQIINNNVVNSDLLDKSKDFSLYFSKLSQLIDDL